MNQVVHMQNQNFAKIEQVLIGGDLARLTEGERLQYYKAVCESVGLNPLTKPFDYITLNGKLTLYARKDATDQLRNIHKVSISIPSREQIGDVYVVTAQAKNADGREDSSTGAVFIGGLRGDALANAIMKAETKAKRRVTLSICGLGLLDETELEIIPPEANSTNGGIHPQQPAVGDGHNHDTGYKIPFGKFQKRALEEIDPKALGDYVNFLERSAEKKGQQITGQVADFIKRASDYLAALELGDTIDDTLEEINKEVLNGRR